MDDLISRQAAIDALNGEFTITGRENAETIRNYIDGVDKRLRELPSAERRGRWVVLGDQIENQTFDECKCSECGCVEYFNKGWKHFDYCPNCGARMDGDEK